MGPAPVAPVKLFKPLYFKGMWNIFNRNGHQLECFKEQKGGDRWVVNIDEVMGKFTGKQNGSNACSRAGSHLLDFYGLPAHLEANPNKHYTLGHVSKWDPEAKHLRWGEAHVAIKDATEFYVKSPKLSGELLF